MIKDLALGRRLRFFTLLIIALISLMCWMLVSEHSSIWSVSSASTSSIAKPGFVPVDSSERARVNQAYGQLPLSFEANHGQTDAQVKFFARGSGYTLFLTPTEAVLSLNQQDMLPSPQNPPAANTAGTGKAAVVRMRLKNANRVPVISGEGELTGTLNYLKGVDQGSWQRNVAAYSKVRYEEVYPNIDLVYYGNQQQLEYDFVVKPGGNPRLIKLTCEGADKLRITKEGDLVLSIGDDEVRMKRPVIYQLDDNGERREIAGRFRLSGRREVSFRVKGYDMSKSLVIDPVLTYSTYLGGSFHDYAYAIAVDSAGSAYVTGKAGSFNFPTTPGVYQTSPNDIFVTKLNSSGSGLVYSTYFGGSSTDNSYSIAVDQSGNAVITGSSSSADFPLVNSLKTRSQLYKTTDAANWANSNTGLAPDVRAIAVHPTNSSLVYAGTNAGVFRSTDAGSTWASSNSGLPANLIITALAIDPVTPTTIYVGTGVNAVYKSTDGGNSWAPANNGLPGASPIMRVLVIDPTSPATVYVGTNSGVYKTPNGGVSWGAVNSGLLTTNIGSLVLEPAAPGTLYASGVSSGTVYKTTNGGGNWSNTSTGLSTLPIAALATDPIVPGTAYAVGTGGFYKTVNGGANWAPSNSGLASFPNLLSIAIPAGQSQVIYVGSNGGQNGGVYKSINGGGSWNVANAGLWSTSISAIACSPASLTTLFAAANVSFTDYDAFVARLSPNGQTLTFSTLLGGTADETGNGIAVDLSGNVYVTGTTKSNNFPTVNAFQTVYNDGAGVEGNAFVTKINAAGNAYIYSTYLGGTTLDEGNGITVDATGNAYVTGDTLSANFPAVNAFQQTFGGGSWDAFVAKFGSNGSLAYSTFLGGSSDDKGYGIAVDAVGSTYVTGLTTSNNFPLANPLQATRAGSEDVFVTKFNSLGSALVYSTYLGGETTDVGRGIAVDVLGNAYVGGFTQSQGFPLVSAVRTKSNFYKSTNSGGTWGNINYGLTVPITAIVVNPANSQIIYAGTQNGVFKSVNNGNNWTAVNNGLTDLQVSTLVIDPATPSTLYAGTQNTGVFKSTNSGASWTPSSSGTSNNILSLAIDPVTPSTLYAGVYGNNVYKSINNGANWSIATATLSFVRSLVIDPLNPNTLYAGEDSSEGGVHKSVDGGINWQPINNGLPSPFVISLAIDPVTPSTLYVSCNGIHKSIDGGANWSLILLQARTVTVDPGSPQTLYAVTNAGVEKSTNGGATWTPLTNGLPTQVSAGQVVVDPHLSSSVYFGSVANVTGDDAFAAKINVAGSALSYSTFLGNGNGFGIALDSNNSAYVTGLIHAGALSTTPGAFDTIGGGLDDAFVVKLDPSWSISGIVTGTGGAPLSGATVTLSGGAQVQTALSGGDGAYSFPTVREGGNFALSAFKIGYDFTPQVFNVNNLDSDRIVNFSGVFVTYNLSGHIAVGQTPLSGVTVALSGSASGTTVTDMNGDYSIAAPKYGNYTLTPALAGYFFAPLSLSFTNLVSNQTANFAAIAGYPINGHVTRNGAGVSGVTVSLSGTASTTTTDESGFYTLDGVAGGSFYITPTASGYTFIPPTQFVGNLSAPQTLNFEAVRLPGVNGKIAFVGQVGLSGSEAEIYTMNDGGGDIVRLTNNTFLDSTPVWSPNGRKIAFTSVRFGSEEIFAMNADGSNQTNLTNDPSIDIDPAWSPNGNKIAFTSYRAGGASHIFLMDPDGSNQLRVTTATAPEGHPSWSPDGTRLVYHNYQHGATELYIVNADGSNPTRLTNSTDYEFDPEWSPDGNKIVFVYGLSDFNKEIYVINADGTGRMRLTNNTVQDYAPAWSPDSTRIIFSGEAGGPLNNREIYMMNVDGSNRVRLTNVPQADFEPTWQRHPFAHNPADFDGDEKTDVSVFRPSSGFWYILQSSNTAFRADQFGLGTDKIAPADYDGDNRADVAVFRQSNGYWYILRSSDNAFQATQFGQADDIPTPADFDGDGKTDLCVYRPSNNYFYLLYSTDNSFHFEHWGASGDLPVIGDYDGDNKGDFGVFRPSVAAFYVLRSSDGTVIGQQFGLSDDRPIASDFDGDGKTDIAVYRQSLGEWYYLRSSDGGFRGIDWGSNDDLPAVGDYDGDGKSDVAVFRPSGGVFYILQSATNSLRVEQFGISGDFPTPSAYVP